MKRITTLIFIAIVTCFMGTAVQAQCPVISCPSDISVSTDAGVCGAVLNYATPVGTDACSSAGNVLFVSDDATASEIPAELTAAGYTVTAVYNDCVGGNNATLQGSLAGYSAIFWHASGSNGYGEAHNAATFSNLTPFVTAGGAVFVTGYDVIASPFDAELITFLGGTGSIDGPGGVGTIVGSNSLTTGVVNIVGMALNYPADHDVLTGLQAGTVGVMEDSPASGNFGWSVRTLGAGEIAWVSSAQIFGSAFPSWNTPGDVYNSALLNFAFNHSCTGIGNFLFVSDNAGGTEIPAALTAAGHTVTSVYNDFNTGQNPTLTGALNGYDAIFWNAVGYGSGDVHNAPTFANLTPYINAGGMIFVTGYDVLVSPVDPEMITFLGGTSGNDVGPGGQALLGANSLTTGYATITGLVPNAIYGDYDDLNGLIGSVEVVLPGSVGGGAEWCINTIGAGEAAWVSSGQYGTNAMPEWTTPGSVYHEALLNFAYNAANCGGGSPITTMTAGLASGSTFPVGTTLVTYNVTDYQGNNAQSCSFNVTVTDIELPIADAGALADVNDCASITLTSPTATDNCAGSITGIPDVAFPITAAGTTVVTWTYDDGNGNFTTQTQNAIINTVNTGVSQAGAVLTSNAGGAMYQWLDCDNAYAIIPGETGASFTPTAVVGNYAVSVTENGCTDTSACYLVDYTGIDELSGGNVVIFPNPSTGVFEISFNGVNDTQLKMDIIDLQGRVILSENMIILNEKHNQKVDISESAKGVYMIQIIGVNGVIMAKRISKS